MRERRFLVEPGDLLESQAIIRGGELRHLRKVLRLRAGDPVAVFDGRGRGYRGRLRAVEPGRAVVALEEAEPPETEPLPAIHLFQGILHTDRMEAIVEKVTELGVREITPVVSARSIARPGKGGWGRLDRLRRIAVSAAKQSGRLTVPEIHEPGPFGVIMKAAEEPGAGALRILCHPGSPSLARAMGAVAGVERVHLLVGPEGGWTEEEAGAAAGAGWEPAGLGPTTLRADTAAILAAGLVLCLAESPGKATEC